MKSPNDKPGPNPKLTEERVIAALENTGGIRTAAAHALRVHRATLYRFLDANPHIKKRMIEIEEQTLDMAEGAVLKAIKSEQMDTVRWFLDRKGRHRGYGHRSEVSGPNGGPIPVEPTIDPSKLSTEALKELRAAAVTADAADAE